jgi:hypothetical protein
MSGARASDGLLEAEQVYALLDLIRGSSSHPAPDQLARELRARASASAAKTLNTIEMLRKFEVLELVGGHAKLCIGDEWGPAEWHSHIGRVTALTLADRLLHFGPVECLQRAAANGRLWIDSMSLPGSHDGLAFWAIEFAAAIREHTTSRLWRVAEPYEVFFIDVARQSNIRHARRLITAEQFAAQRDRDAANGLLAEEWVLARERERLKDHPLLDQVRRISDEDVSAGFDILSFSSSNALQHDLHIEVKSYARNCHFFWSRNEVEIAQELGERYSLYLVDRSAMTRPGYRAQIIKGPYSAMFQTGLPGWTVSIDAYECTGPTGEATEH